MNPGPHPPDPRGRNPLGAGYRGGPNGLRRSPLPSHRCPGGKSRLRHHSDTPVRGSVCRGGRNRHSEVRFCHSTSISLVRDHLHDHAPESRRLKTLEPHSGTPGPKRSKPLEPVYRSGPNGHRKSPLPNHRCPGGGSRLDHQFHTPEPGSVCRGGRNRHREVRLCH